MKAFIVILIVGQKPRSNCEHWRILPLSQHSPTALFSYLAFPLSLPQLQTACSHTVILKSRKGEKVGEGKESLLCFPFQIRSEKTLRSPHRLPLSSPWPEQAYIPHSKPITNKEISSVQSFSCVQLFAIPWTAAHQASLSITNSWSLLKLMSIKSVMPSNHLILCYPLLLLPSVFPSIRVFSNESVLRIRWPEYWSFSFNISPSNEYSGLVSFRMDWLDPLAVQGTLKSLLQDHSSKASILWCSAFFIVHTLLLEKP